METKRSKLVADLKRLIALRELTTDPKVCKTLDEMIQEILSKLRDLKNGN